MNFEWFEIDFQRLEINLRRLFYQFGFVFLNFKPGVLDFAGEEMNFECLGIDFGRLFLYFEGVLGRLEPLTGCLAPFLLPLWQILKL